uniref:Uncharacterized protein n=1 Tax=Lotharella globosa TaxID=91324 RepID=A0A7S3YIL0_9EUKA
MLDDLTPVNTCKNLTYLDVSNNKIKDITTLELPLLNYFNVSGNKVSYLTEMNSFELLQTFNLSRNNIASLHGLHHHPSLAYLDLAQNGVCSIFQITELAGLKNLRRLNMLGNPVQNTEQYRLRTIYSIPHLTELDGKNTSAVEKVAAANLKGIGNPVNQAILRHFLPQGDHTSSTTRYQHRMSREMAKYTGKLPMLPHQAYRAKIGVSSEAESPEGKKRAVISPANSQLLSLPEFWWQMAENRMIAGWKDFIKMVKSGKLIHIDFSNINVGDIGMWAISQSLRFTNVVTSINLASSRDPTRWAATRSDQYGLKLLLETVSYSMVQNLNLSGCHLGIDETKLIADLINTSSVLQTLNIADNMIGASVSGPAPDPFTTDGSPRPPPETKRAHCNTNGAESAIHPFPLIIHPCPGLEAISRALMAPDAAPITHLCLKNNAICGYGAEWLAKVLMSKRCRLVELDISENDLAGAAYMRPSTAGATVKTEGGVLIAEALKVNKSLEKLIIKGHPENKSKRVSPRVASALAKMLHTHNRSLKYLDMEYSQCGDEGAVAFGSCLSSSPWLRRHVPRLNDTFPFAKVDRAINQQDMPTDINLPSAPAENPYGVRVEAKSSSLESVKDEMEDPIAHNLPSEEMLEGGCGSVLEYISLRHCQIESKGMKALAEGMGRNSCVKFLDLSFNSDASPESVDFLIEKLCENENLALKSLFLEGMAFLAQDKPLLVSACGSSKNKDKPAEKTGEGSAASKELKERSDGFNFLHGSGSIDAKSTDFDHKQRAQEEDEAKNEENDSSKDICLEMDPRVCTFAGVAVILNAAKGTNGVSYSIKEVNKLRATQPDKNNATKCGGMALINGKEEIDPVKAIKHIVEAFQLRDPFIPMSKGCQERCFSGLSMIENVLYPLMERTAFVKMGLNQGTHKSIEEGLRELDCSVFSVFCKSMLQGDSFVGGEEPCIADFLFLTAFHELSCLSSRYTKNHTLALPNHISDYLARVVSSPMIQNNEEWIRYISQCKQFFQELLVSEPVVVAPNVADRVKHLITSNPKLTTFKATQVVRVKDSDQNLVVKGEKEKEIQFVDIATVRESLLKMELLAIDGDGVCERQPAQQNVLSLEDLVADMKAVLASEEVAKDNNENEKLESSQKAPDQDEANKDPKKEKIGERGDAKVVSKVDNEKNQEPKEDRSEEKAKKVAEDQVVTEQSDELKNEEKGGNCLCPKLVSISVANGSFSWKTWMALCFLIKQAPNLKTILLSGMSFVDIEASNESYSWEEVFGSLFHACQDLGPISLSLRDSSCINHPNALEHLARFIENSQFLISLDLRGCFVDVDNRNEDAVGQVLAVLASNSRLFKLNLSNNAFDMDHISHFATIRTNNVMQVVCSLLHSPRFSTFWLLHSIVVASLFI